MKPFEQLTERGRLIRLRRVAEAALARYAVRPRRVKLIGGFMNAVYRIDTDDGTFAMRVDLAQDHSDHDVGIEVAWLEALEQSGLPCARVVRPRDGSPFVYAEAEGVPRARRCVLFRWIGGGPLADRATEASYRALGRLSAALHEHARTVTVPGRPMAWDRPFYYPPEVDPYVVDDPAYAHLYSDARRAIVAEARAHVEPAFARRDASGFRILHGDLHPWNVHIRRGALTAFDFEDVMWGHPVQDVAITLFYLREREDYRALRAAFEAGYTERRAWPETYPGEIDRFVAARDLMFTNFVGHTLPDPAPALERIFGRLEAYLRDVA